MKNNWLTETIDTKECSNDSIVCLGFFDAIFFYSHSPQILTVENEAQQKHTFYRNKFFWDAQD